MSTKRMLIDATHPEETRVVVLNGTRLEDFDVEVASRKQLKGNIYLAKVTRVEPSLQAAFVDYGGNRHGFLSFNEIHPDYYQIPVTDRERILAEHQAHALEDDTAHAAANGNGEGAPAAEGEEAEERVETVGGDDSDEVEDRRPNSYALRRQYKIQEVIKRRQILLVQVVKEERGNKGAALTTYLSLAGRYCVLMPNTARGGGISRKISPGADRKRLKSIIGELELPDGMAVIVRTAGAERGKSEIKRDYDYLLRLWDSVRKLTLESIAPTLVYEEGNLIKRAVRDLYDRDIDEIVVDGEDGYRIAKDFMKLLIPSHVKRVKRYADEAMPLFHRYQVENQLDGMHSPVVQLKSGGYIVINSTEALVAIDVNSGRATRERNIEETALRTNVEAAEEIARQLRLRDLAGLVVIDFIDMEMPRNRIQVERRLKDAMRTDRARIQLGRISPFGLLELSRQRLRPSLTETSFGTCPHCAGTGLIRSTDSAALQVLRAIEEEGIRRRCGSITVLTPTPIALYLLNQKRPALGDIETRYGIHIEIRNDDSIIAPNHLIEWTKPALAELPETEAIAANAPMPEVEEQAAEEPAPRPAEEEAAEDESGRKRRRRRPRRRRREDGEVQTGSGESVPVPEPADQDAPIEAADEVEAAPASEAGEATPERDEEDAEARAKRRRRGKRGGRRRRGGRPEHDQRSAEEATAGGDVTVADPALPVAMPETVEVEAAPFVEAVAIPEDASMTSEPIPVAFPEAPVAVDPPVELPVAEDTEAAPKRPARRRRKPRPAEAPAAEAVETPPVEEAPQAAAEPPAERRKPRRRRPAKKDADAIVAPEPVTEPEPADEQPKAAIELGETALPVLTEEPPFAAVSTVAEAIMERPEPEEASPAKPAEDHREPDEVPPADPLSASIVHVGAGPEDDAQKPKRRGWWQRLTS